MPATISATVWDHLADGDVVLQEQRFGAAHHEVVDAHGHQVLADGVMFADRLRDGEFGTDASLAAASTGSR